MTEFKRLLRIEGDIVRVVGEGWDGPDWIELFEAKILIRVQVARPILDADGVALEILPKYSFQEDFSAMGPVEPCGPKFIQGGLCSPR